MGRICLVAAAVIILAASWAVAGNFEVLAEAGVVKAPTQLHLRPGTPVKAEFRSNLTAASDIELETDALLPEKVAAKGDVRVLPRPAIAYRERLGGGMAPPPNAEVAPEHRVSAAAEDQEVTDLEGDLEKDLVLTPPPPKATEQQDLDIAPPSEKRSGKEKPAVSNKKPNKKKAAPSVRQKTPSDYDQYAAGAKPIRKVRPLSSNPWGVPAGNYENRCCPPVNTQALMAAARGNAPRTCAPMNNPYPETRHALIPPTTDRFVRDGVTIRLAPAAAPLAPEYYDEEGYDSDILSTATEILGLPFALISSFF